MGCGINKEFILSDRSNSQKYCSKKFEDYAQSDIQTYTVYYYKLLWKTRPIVCFYQLKEQEKFSKRDINNLNILLKQKIVNIHNNIDLLTRDRLIIYYIHCTYGAIVTRNSSKINYYLSNYIDNIIDVCLVDISNIYLNGGDKFNIYEVKNQSKYFFNLNMKEIDFSNRNQLINLGKQEQIYAEENIEEDEELEEKIKILKNNEIIVKFNRKKYVNGGLNEEKDFFQINNKSKDKEKGKKEKNEKRESKEKNKITNKNNKERKSIKVRNSIFKSKNGDNNLLINLVNSKDLIKNDIEVYNRRSSITNLKNSKIPKINVKQAKSLQKRNSIYNAKEKSSRPDKDSILEKLSQNQKYNKNSPIKKEDQKTCVIDGNISSINNNPDSNFSNNNNLYSISEKFERNSTLKKNGTMNVNEPLKDSNKNIINFAPYEIIDKCLIIKENRFCPELNKELQKLLYEDVEDDDYENNLDKDKDSYSPYDHIKYCVVERSKKKKSTKTLYQNIKSVKSSSINNGLLANIDKESINGMNDKKIYDYIIIHNRFKIPYELRVSKNNINKIVFAECDFSGESLYYLKEFIDMLTNYKNLKQIKIYQNPNISTNFTGWKLLKKLFLENFNIRWVSLKNGGLDDKLAEIIISSMLLKRIRYLNISNNKITDKEMYHLNKFLIKNQTLSVLYMSKNPNITIEGIRLITNALQMHPNIIKLDISSMNLAGSGQFFATLLSENKCLQELNLRNTNLNKSDITFLASKLILEESRIICLDIGLNINIGDEGLKEIGKIINNNRSLKSIGLDGLNLTMNNYLPIFEAICKNRNIENYSLNMNLGLPFKGILNFFLKNPQVKEISITPWDIETEHDQKFTQDQLYSIEKFHLKAPHVIIRGITFVESNECENNNENK